MSRADFAMDALFGMPGVPHEPGCCIVLNEGQPDERFQHPHTEATYQVWLRGYQSKELAVRDELSRIRSEDRDDYAAYVALMQEWQESGFIPKRPGD